MKGGRSGRWQALVMVVVLVGVGFAVGLNVPNTACAKQPGDEQQTTKPEQAIWTEQPAADVQKSSQMLPSFAPLVKKASPAVVNISFEKTIAAIPRGMPYGGQDPFGDFFERFFGQRMPHEFKNKGLGSGFIISADGMIVTNNHVVENADKITVKLMDDEKELDAKVIGRDPKTDIALIKVESGRALPVLPLGDSDKLEVGDWVVAIGNPLGLSNTVTKGIVSFKGRKDIRPGGAQAGYYDFIQTDAPINPGNSGGPLINLAGEAVGVNESMVGGAQNIGFAVPINMVKAVISGLRENGRVVRSWLGVQIQPVTKDLADSFGMKEPEGALVADVVQGGPAEKAGIKAGDVVVAFNGKHITRSEDLPWLASNAGVGKDATVRIFRNGAYKDVKVTMGELPESGKDGRPVKEAQPGGKAEELGLKVMAVTPEMAEKLDVKPGRGVLVVEVKDNSGPARAGIEPNDIILKLNDHDTNSPGDFMRLAGAIKKGQVVRMLVKRGEGSLFVAFKKE